MSGKKKILIVDDAVVVRRTVADIVAADPDLEVSGTASNGRIALTKFAAQPPDLVLLDIEMPEMDGLETLVEMRKLDRRIPILMFSTLTDRGAEATLEALSRGATDYVTKPSNSDIATTSDAVTRELIPKIRALCHLPWASASAAAPIPHKPVSATPPRPHLSIFPAQLIAIGVSTGGPDALARLLPTLPAKLPVPIVIAQHMPPTFTSLLARRLSDRCAIAVKECRSGDLITPGCVFVAPGDFHMIVSAEDGVIRLRVHQGPKENFCRPSVDVLFRSVASVYGAKAMGIILTGMGQDGVKGCEVLHQTGARIIAQDEASSIVWGMPGYVARAGLADKVLPLDQIGAEIIKATSFTRSAHR